MLMYSSAFKIYATGAKRQWKKMDQNTGNTFLIYDWHCLCYLRKKIICCGRPFLFTECRTTMKSVRPINSVMRSQYFQDGVISHPPGRKGVSISKHLKVRKEQKYGHGTWWNQKPNLTVLAQTNRNLLARHFAFGRKAPIPLFSLSFHVYGCI
jgi:hypothetical protein